MIRFLQRIFPVLLLLLLFSGCAERRPESWILQNNASLGYPAASDQILERKGFTLGYSVSDGQALWVSYILRADDLRKPAVPRDNFFTADPEVKGVAVTYRDYSGTGFDRGHLAPAADMAYSPETMSESFRMSNISPQTPECNRRYWLEVEKMVRRWALKEEFIYVITGPYFAPGERRKLGKSAVSVPQGFYKAVMDLTPPYKMIALYAANDPAERYRVLSVDELEKLTGCDFFSELDDALENVLEQQKNLSEWSE